MNSALKFSLAPALVLSLLGLSLLSHAQVSAVPSAMTFQGRLATPSGNPVPDGTYSVRFSLWDAASAGTEKWNKTVSAVNVKNGTFAVTLDAFPANTFNGNLWLEIKIGTDTPLAPRTPLVTVPYAFKAGSVADGSLTSASFASGALNSAVNSLAWLLGGNSGTNPASQFLGTTDAQPLVFKTNNAERLRLDASDNVLANGNLIVDNASSNNGAATDNLLRFGGATSGEGIASKRTAGGNQYGLDFYTFSNLRMTITGSGNVGIGTNTPGFPLSFPDSVGDKISLYGQSGNHYGLGIQNSLLQIHSADATTDIVFGYGQSAAFNETMRIKGNGNVGIGTNTPGAKLDVAGQARFSSDGAAGASVVGTGNNNNPAEIYFDKTAVGATHRSATGYAANRGHFVWVNGSDRLNILSNGNVGIGTTSPAAKLDVSGKTRFTYDGNAGVSLVGTGNNTNSAEIVFDKTAAASYHISATGYAPDRGHYVWVNGSDRLNIAPNGYVGIGTSSPAAQLEVRSSTTATSLATSWQILPGTLFGSPSPNSVTLDIPGVAGTLGIWDNLALNGSMAMSGTANFSSSYAPFQNTILSISNTNTNLAGIVTNLSVNAASFFTLSDKNLKTNIEPLSDALDSVLKLRGVQYNWKQGSKSIHPTETGKQIGFLAQEVEQVMPELVKDSPMGYKAVNYQGVVPYLVEAIKTLNARTVIQQKQKAASEAEVAQLKAKNAELEARLERLEAALKAQR